MRRRRFLSTASGAIIFSSGCIVKNQKKKDSGEKKPKTLKEKLDAGGWSLKEEEDETITKETPVGKVDAVTNTKLYRNGGNSQEKLGARFFFVTRSDIKGLPFGFSRAVDAAAKQAKTKFVEKMKAEGLSNIKKTDNVDKNIGGNRRKIHVYSAEAKNQVGDSVKYSGMLTVWGDSSERKVFVTGGIYPDEPVDGGTPSEYRSEILDLMSSVK
ncbi:MAG: hypothetical protein ABEK59_03530 [Halobacteria archaeon]